ncbi:MAG: cytochrome c [Acidobacteriota bacterium]
MKNTLKQFVIFAFFSVCVSGWLYSESSGAATKNPLSKSLDTATLYKKNCASCHGKDGQAKSFRGKLLNAQNLTDADWQAKVSDEHIFNIITNGRKKMPTFGKKLSEEEINSLVDYIRKLKK